MVDNKDINKQKGQVALVVLIVSAVVLTLGLSTSKKTVTETKIVSDEEMLKQAFNTAESAIDYYLTTGKVGYTDSATNYQATISTNDIVADNNHVMGYDEETLVSTPVFFWLVGHNGDGTINYANMYGGSTIDICTNNSFNGSVKVDYYYRLSTTAYGVKREGYNVVPGSSHVENYIDVNNPSADSCGSGRKLLGTVDTANNPLMIALTPLGSSGRMAVRGSTDLPVQGEEVSSTSVVGEPNTGVRRTIKILRRYEISRFMLDAITAGGNIGNN